MLYSYTPCIFIYTMFCWNYKLQNYFVLPVTMVYLWHLRIKFHQVKNRLYNRWQCQIHYIVHAIHLIVLKVICLGNGKAFSFSCNQAVIFFIPLLMIHEIDSNCLPVCCIMSFHKSLNLWNLLMYISDV